MEKVLLIDSNALMYRAYHALPPLKNEGEVVNALYGFFLIFIKALEDVEPDYVVAAFDRKEKTFRHDMFEDYKAQRPDMPEDLVSQIPLIKEGLKSFKTPALDKKGFEADDIIATLAKRWEKNAEVVILTGDRDLLQLVNDRVSVRSPGRGIKKMINFDKEKVVNKYGLPPKLFVDYKALRGDPSDNIPGVEGIGKKRAAQLIQKYGSVEDIYNNFDELKDTFKKRLKGKKEEVLKGKKLVLLREDVDLTVTLEGAKLNYKDEEVLEFFKRFNFKTLIEKYKPDDNQMELNL
ncbi:MAG: 5'-3' exonuclease [Patescibacteria group bacterium]